VPAAAPASPQAEKGHALLAHLGYDPCNVDTLCQRSGLTPDTGGAIVPGGMSWQPYHTVWALRLPGGGGHLGAEERRRILRVFEFSDTVVREAMGPRQAIAAIAADCSLADITEAFQQHRYSRLPVYRGSLDSVIGFIHSKDLMPYLMRPQEFSLEYVLQPPMYVVDTARLEDVLRQMQKAKTHFGFVVDEHGGVEGIITLEDLLEEIVGDISDEHDEEVNEQINQVDERNYLLDGSLAVRDLNRRLKISVPESEAYTTIGGFLMTVAGHVLQPGEVIEHGGLRFHVENVERRRLLRVRLELPEKKVEETPETATSAAHTSR